jgi:hypothetical protein
VKENGRQTVAAIVQVARSGYKLADAYKCVVVRRAEVDLTQQSTEPFKVAVSAAAKLMAGYNAKADRYNAVLKHADWFEKNAGSVPASLESMYEVARALDLNAKGVNEAVEKGVRVDHQLMKLTPNTSFKDIRSIRANVTPDDKKASRPGRKNKNRSGEQVPAKEPGAFTKEERANLRKQGYVPRYINELEAKEIEKAKAAQAAQDQWRK